MIFGYNNVSNVIFDDSTVLVLVIIDKIPNSCTQYKWILDFDII